MHHASTMDLDVLLSRSEVEGDLLVQFSSNHMLHHFPFTRREAGETRCDGGRFALFRSTRERCPDCAQKIGVLNRLDKEIHGSRLHRADAHGDVAMAGEKDDWEKDVLMCKPSLKMEAIQIGHGHIQNQAAIRAGAESLEKARRCGESPHFESVGAQQTRDSLDHTRLVIQKINQAIWIAHDKAGAITGSSIRSVTPRPLLGSAQSRP